MKFTKDTVFPFDAFAVEPDAKIKKVKIVSASYGYSPKTSRGKRYSSKDIVIKKSEAIKLAERKLRDQLRRINMATAFHDRMAANIALAKASA